MLNLIGINQKHRNLSDLIGPLLRIEPGSPVILLAHYPSTVYWFNGAIDLVIAGHTHGGQVRLPGLPHMTNDDFSWRHAAGLHRIGQTQLVVSRGMGRSGLLPFRVFAPAELTVVELKSTVSPEAAD